MFCFSTEGEESLTVAQLRFRVQEELIGALVTLTIDILRAAIFAVRGPAICVKNEGKFNKHRVKSRQ